MPNTRGDTTRELLIIHAERLFAHQGIAAVTMREITEAAGQRNNVAIPYHFGDREGLIRAITIYRSRRTEDLRSRMLTELLARPIPLQVADLAEAMIRPMTIHFEDGNHNLGFQSRLLAERGAFADTSAESDVPAAMGIIPDLLCHCLPGLPAELVKLRFWMALTAAVHTLAHYQHLLHSDALPLPLDTLVEDLIAFIGSGLDSDMAPGGNAS